MKIEKSQLKQLTDRGLVLSGPLPYNHVCPSAWMVLKPADVLGNSVVNRKRSIGDGKWTDAPRVSLYFKSKRYWVEVHQFVPGPGAGDFRRSFSKLERAIREVLKYFFDPSSKMLEYDKHRRLAIKKAGRFMTHKECAADIGVRPSVVLDAIRQKKLRAKQVSPRIWNVREYAWILFKDKNEW